MSGPCWACRARGLRPVPLLGLWFALLPTPAGAAGGITDDEKLLFSDGKWHRAQRKRIAFTTACGYSHEPELPHGCQAARKEAPEWTEQSGRRADKSVLWSMFVTTGGKDGKWRASDNWVRDSDPCWDNWYGVTCDEHGRVIYLELADNGLRGDFPGNIGQLTSLLKLDLSTTAPDYHSHPNKYRNQLKGKMGTFRMATRIEEIEVSGNQITELPEDLWMNGPTMRSLSANHNLLKSLPQYLLRFDRLHTLELAHNRIRDEWPDDFGKLTNLRFLQLQYNRLRGRIGITVIGMNRNRVFDVSHNPTLEGVIPQEIVIHWGDQEYISILNCSLGGYLASLCSDVPFCWRFMYDTHGDMTWTSQEGVSDVVLETITLAMKGAGLAADDVESG